ncbi:MAG: potassium channel family protein [Phycisphaeraceae bacterium]|nr:potassium channel family protein [Phycisphaeraceae bacterium]MCB9847051.1 potassium channel family protein [Phycisphaeraceae bacterium]
MADAANEPYWDDENRDPATGRFPPAWTNQQELQALADAIVRGASITHAEIPELRHLINAVQAHPDATLVRRDADGNMLNARTGASIRDESSVTILSINGGEILSCKCGAHDLGGGLDIGCTLAIIARFKIEASFGSASFAGGASFAESSFAEAAWFDWANFAGGVSFEEASFAGGASFGSASFTGGAWFKQANFAGTVWFDRANFAVGGVFEGTSFACAVSFSSASFVGGAWFEEASFAGGASFDSASFAGGASFDSVSFAGAVSFSSSTFVIGTWFRETEFAGAAWFDRASFAGGAWFEEASFAEEVSFCSATIDLRLILKKSIFGSRAKFSIDDVIVRAGASIELSLLQLECEESVLEVLIRWRKSRSWMQQFLAHRRVRRLCRPLRSLCWPLVGTFGFGRRGTLILGEDRDDARSLREASAAYNLLRDTFRNQPSTDEQEEICNFKYLDLKRRAKYAELREKKHWKPRDSWSLLGVWLDWLIRRNALGYMVEWWRIPVTGGLVIGLIALFYGAAASPGTLGYFSDSGDWLWGNQPIVNPIYYSVVTFTSLGYGDIQPVAWWMKLIAASEALIGVSLMALFIVAWARKMVR